MPEIREFKCPKCGSSVGFDSATQKMKCPYCSTLIDVSEIDDLPLEGGASEEKDGVNLSDRPGTEWEEGETDNFKVYVCNSCGGEIIGDAEMAATSCPYCNNAVVIPSQFKGDLKPDFLIPFKLDKEEAKASLRRHVTGRRLVPKVFKDENHIDEIKGIYVPFWLFDAKTHVNASFSAEERKHWSDSKNNYTETKYYNLEREADMEFQHVAIDGSSKLADDLMESLEPFDFDDAVSFKTAYLAGYLADRYDVDIDASIGRANERIRTSARSMIESTVGGYNSVSTQNVDVHFYDTSASYALYPVWLLNTSWNGGKYTFAMNGQTGKFVGDLPVDKGQLTAWRIGIGAAVAAAAFVLSYLGWMFV